MGVGVVVGVGVGVGVGVSSFPRCNRVCICSVFLNDVIQFLLKIFFQVQVACCNPKCLRSRKGL